MLVMHGGRQLPRVLSACEREIAPARGERDRASVAQGAAQPVPPRRNRPNATRRRADVVLVSFHDSSADVLPGLVVADAKMLALIESAQVVARHDAAVLITGETGVGKEVIARLIHQHSPRSARPWVDLNCAALPEHLVESELFGYEKGAFSGADAAKPGLFDAANGGTLFLDEIGDLDPRVQVKLLRVLDGMPYYRLGGSRKVSADIRVIAATNRDLATAVREGGFRRDLYHRIGEVHLIVPPLRERPGDILALAKYFLAQRRPEARFTPEAQDFLTQLAWRGNVRELRNLVLKLAVLNSHEEISVEDVRRFAGEPEPMATATTTATSGTPQSEIVSISEMERRMIVRALEVTGGNQTRAAERLGMPRRTFCRKLQQFAIPLERRRRVTAKPDGEPPHDHRKVLHVPVSIATSAGRRLAATACNLSLGGVGLRNAQPPLAVGEKIGIELSLPDGGQSLELPGVVAWSQTNGAAGVRFEQLTEAQREALHRWISGPQQYLLAESPEPAPYDREALAFAQAGWA